MTHPRAWTGRCVGGFDSGSGGLKASAGVGRNLDSARMRGALNLRSGPGRTVEVSGR